MVRPANDCAPLLPLLRQHLPNLLTLGEYEPERRQGPAVWLRTAAGRALPDIIWPPDMPAIVYLPGVARDALHAAEDCPPQLQLLAWLVVGGAAFVHPNGRDWTLRGFLATKQANGGLGLEVPQDEATRHALLLAAPKLFTLPVAELQGRRLDADWLHALLAPDLNDDMLAWLDGKLDAASDPARFAAFQAQAKSKLKLDLAKVSRERAAERLLQRDDAWAPIWSRFTSSAQSSTRILFRCWCHRSLRLLCLPIPPSIHRSIHVRKQNFVPRCWVLRGSRQPMRHTLFMALRPCMPFAVKAPGRRAGLRLWLRPWRIWLSWRWRRLCLPATPGVGRSICRGWMEGRLVCASRSYGRGASSQARCTGDGSRGPCRRCGRAARPLSAAPGA